MMFTPPSAPDPFDTLAPEFDARFNRNVGTKTLRAAQAPVAGETVGVLIVAGQSNAANTAGDGTAYTPTNPAKIDNLFLSDGGVYAASDPLLGTENGYAGEIGNVFTRVADKLVTAGWRQRVVIASVAIGATSATQWDALLYRRIVAAHRRALAKGFTVDGICWQQGETDTALETSQAAYTASMTSLMGKVAAAGVSAPWLIAKGTLYLGAASTAIRAAQTALVNGSTVLAGPDTDTLTGTNRRPDNTHFSLTGADAAATLWTAAIQAAF